MLKPLIFILILVILAALELNFNFFFNKDTTSNSPHKTHATPMVKVENTKKIKKTIIEELPKSSMDVNSSKDDALAKELNQLLQKANIFFQKSEDNEALKLYNEIIVKSIKSKSPKILKIFAHTIFAKALLHNIYPNSDPDSAIEAYDVLLKRFHSTDDKELLKLYMQAKISQAKLLSKDDLLTAYDDLINKFKNDKEHRFDREVEELLFAKSFALMGENDEEAMEALDNIIANYKDNGNKKLPTTVQYSILNNIELSIITDNNEEKYVDLANKYLSDEQGTKPLLEMLNIIKNAQDIEQDEAIKEWKEKYSNYSFPDWDFSELDNWAHKMENLEGQARIENYLKDFKQQKYNRLYQQQRVNAENTQSSNTKTDKESQTSIYNEEELDEENTNSEEEIVENTNLQEETPVNYESEELIEYDNPYAEMNYQGVEGSDTPY